jgi:hypothetical protein
VQDVSEGGSRRRAAVADEAVEVREDLVRISTKHP